MARKILASVFPGISGSDRRARLRAALLGTTLLIAVPSLALAQVLPTDGTVASGNVTINNPSPSSMLILQNSNRAVVNWNSFSIGSGNTVNIRQPGVDSAILNRVTGDTTSAIHGSLNANGQVFIVNPNGILIGKDGQVRTGGGFVASTLDVSDDDFNRGRLAFRGDGASAGVTNLGSVTVGRGGYAALIGGRVNNAGTIVAPLGRIGFGAGERVTLDLSGDGFLQVTLPSEDDGDQAALIRNSGRVSADGGLIEMRAATARDAARNAINLSGVAEARSVSMRNGAIVLGGGDGGKVRVSGKVRADAPRQRNRAPATPRQTGGKIELTGTEIRLFGALLDVSGDGGGGTVRIGGDFAGRGAMQHAGEVSADADTQIRADALSEGDGGRIVLWSQRRTEAASQISARGGSEGGDGGLAEVSSAGSVRYRGSTDTRAARGEWGELLIDPEDISVPGTFTEAGIEANLATTSVTLNTANPDLTEPGNILISADIDWTADTTLSLIADNDIIISGDISGVNGGLVLSATADITATGAIDVDRFNLQSGSWSQIAAVLPAFNTNDFRMSSFNATFLRALGGTGTAANPYLLTDVYGLQGMDSDSLLSSHFALANDIDATGTVNWRDGEGGPLGFNPIGDFEDAFTASLNGRGNTIDGLYVGDFNFVGGLFFNTDGAAIRNLDLTGLDINAETDAGGVVGWASNTVLNNVTASGRVTSTGQGFGFTRSAGGLVGEMTAGRIANSSFSGVVRDIGGNDSISGAPDAIAIGGIVGRLSGDGEGGNLGVLNNVTSSGSVLALGDGPVAMGGVAGTTQFASSISNARSSALVRGSTGPGFDTLIAGGLVGIGRGSITDSTASGNVRSVATGGGAVDHAADLGGFVGRNLGTITDSSATGNVFALHDGFNNNYISAGGFVGFSGAGGSISRAFATGNVSITSNDGGSIGGFVGDLDGTITDAFSSGAVSFTQQGEASGEPFAANVGGFAGRHSVPIGAATMIRTAAHGSVTVLGGPLDVNVGGHTGNNIFATITDSYADGAVTSSSDGVQNVGGLVGRTFGGTITNTYASGAVSASGTGTTQVGGLIGRNVPDEGSDPTTTVTASFFDRGRTGQAPNGLPGYGQALTTATFQNTAAFLALAEAQGWDFEAVWAPGDTTGHPAIYTIDRVIFARPDDVTLQYGQAETTGTTGDTFGGPGVYVFAPTGDTADTASVFDSLTFPSVNVGTGQFTLTATSLTSTAGETYRVVDLPADYTITPAPLVITVDDQTKTYGSIFAFGGDEFSTSALFYDDAVDSVTLTSAGAPGSANVGDYAINGSGATGSGLSNYTITYVAGTMTVDPASLVITANDQTKTYGTGFTFGGTEFTTSTLFNGDTVDRIDLTSAGAIDRANVGDYAITGSGAEGSGLSNYVITYEGGTMTVDPASLVITANDQTKTEGNLFTFNGTEFTSSGLFDFDSIDRVDLASDGAPANASADGSPYVITADNAQGDGLSNYTITYVAGEMTVTPGSTPPVIVDNIPRPPVTPEPGLPNPIDTITIDIGTPGSPNVIDTSGPRVVNNPGSTPTETFAKVDDAASLLEIAAESCSQSDADVTRYLACLSDALDDFANKLDEISTDLPPGMENVAQIVRDARRNIDSARARAESRLSTATTQAERDAIRRDAINEARGAIATASAQIREAITLVRADDPELARVQTATINRVAEAVDTVGIQMSRAVGL